MRLVVVSDSHRDTDVLKKIYDIEKNIPSMFIHCGDSCCFPIDIEPFISVRGNCDFLYPYPEELVLPTPIGTIYIFHGVGGLHQIKRKIIEFNPSIILFGHTHVKTHYEIDGVHVFNPGSVSLPRDGEASYLIIEGTNKSDLKWEFKEILK